MATRRSDESISPSLGCALVWGEVNGEGVLSFGISHKKLLKEEVKG